MHIKKNDLVVIISGKERGERGRVLRVLKQGNKVIVERRNLVKRHTKPNQAMGVEGGIVEREAPIHASNVMLFSPKANGPVRTQVRYLGKGGKTYLSREEARQSYDTPPRRIRKVRYVAETEEVFE
ncbi:MAG: 50S ribosomal protein L24 [Bradymonadales bacterium]|nr:50S ribosomal protein L24 [Bradymonadales bacterium]